MLDRVAARGLISAADATAAKREPVPQARLAFPALAAHAAEEAVAADKQAKVIKLSIDARLQAKLETLAKESVARLGPKLSGAIVVIDNATGEIRARVGAADANDASRDGAIDMSRSPRSPGSALKPFIYALAFEQGLAHPETRLFDRPMRYGAYAPENFNLGYEGAVTARKALQMSLNLPAVELLSDVGPATFLARLHSAGAEIALPKDTPIGLAIGLGGLGISLTDLARLYAGFARGGEAPPLIERLDGQPPVIGERRVTDPVAAYYVDGHLARRAAAGERAQRPDRLQDRHVLRLSRRAGDRLRPADDDRGLGRAPGQWPDGRPDRSRGGGADPVRRLRAAGPEHRVDPRAEGRARERPSPPISRRRCAACARTRPRHSPRLRPRRSRSPFRPTARASTSASRRAQRDHPLALKALGGAPPFTWFVNGAPVGEAEIRRQSAWKPDGAGFARVSVTDAKGASDAVRVRLE